MKALLSVVFFFSVTASADVNLQPGEARYVGRTLVTCGGGEQAQDEAWRCSCFDRRGKNHGNVVVYATSKRKAVLKSTDKCRRTFNNYELSADPIGCFVVP